MSAVQVRYFAALREALGPGTTLDVPDGATVADVRRLLQAQGAAQAAALADGRPVRCAVNQVMQDASAPVPPGAEVAFFPPVTGG